MEPIFSKQLLNMAVCRANREKVSLFSEELSGTCSGQIIPDESDQ